MMFDMDLVPTMFFKLDLLVLHKCVSHFVMYVQEIQVISYACNAKVLCRYARSLVPQCVVVKSPCA